MSWHHFKQRRTHSTITSNNPSNLSDPGNYVQETNECISALTESILDKRYRQARPYGLNLLVPNVIAGRKRHSCSFDLRPLSPAELLPRILQSREIEPLTYSTLIVLSWLRPSTIIFSDSSRGFELLNAPAKAWTSPCDLSSVTPNFTKTPPIDLGVSRACQYGQRCTE